MNVIQVETSATFDGEDFGAEYQRLRRPAYELARRLGCTPEEAFDAVQDAAERAWRYRATRRGPFRPWFLSIVYRQATRPKARLLPLLVWNKRASSVEEVDEGVDPDLAAALHRLPRRQQVALWLRYGLDLGVGEVAQVMKTSTSAAKQLLLRARTTLRTELERDEQR